MGPKKLPKSEPSINDFINTESWSCVVVMAVERTFHDTFILKDFYEEAVKGIRKEIKVISYEQFVVKLLQDFTTGEVRYKYAYLLNFASIFTEAGEYMNKKQEIPSELLALVVKAILFYLKHEHLMAVEVKESGPPDPVEEMANRPANFEKTVKPRENNNKKEVSEGKGKKTESAFAKLKIKPPSATKLDTLLQKRGESIIKTEDNQIDDSPLNGCFNLYVLLTGFHQADFPLQLIKAGVPLHGILCVDTSRAEVKPEASLYSSLSRPLVRSSTRRPEEIRHFWDGFLKILWDPQLCSYFKDVILQVYVPQSLLCDKQKIKEFICREISFLMYDISDYKKLLETYLHQMKVRNVKGPDIFKIKGRLFPELDSIPNENVTVPLILQSIIDCICGRDFEETSPQGSYSSDSFDPESELTVKNQSLSCSILNKSGSCEVGHSWSQIIEEMGDPNYSRIFSKIKELDLKYQLDEPRDFLISRENENDRDSVSEEESLKSSLFHKKRTYAANMAEAVNTQEGTFGSYWKKVNAHPIPHSFPVVVDLCLYALLLAKVKCFYAVTDINKRLPSSLFLDVSSTFELIKNVTMEMRKPQFTLVDGTRSIIQLLPFNIKNSRKDIFSPSHLKIVTPEKLKTCSAPQFHVQPKLTTEMSFFSCPAEFEKSLEDNTFTAFESLRKFLKESLFDQVKDFDFIEELSKSKMIMREAQCWDDYNCVDYNYSIFTDTILVILHNRKNSDGIHHEAFNQDLKTTIGLRDFFEYILEDEPEWFEEQLNILNTQKIIRDKYSLSSDGPINFSESVFLIEHSIKFDEREKILAARKEGSVRRTSKDASKVKGSENSQRKPSIKVSKESEEDEISENSSDFSETREYLFEGYNLSNMAVQFSGLKTVYYTADCSVTVELIERLYSTQDLGVHIRQGGHTLHLYSYACPQPHILEPYTFHVTYKNGMCMAFGRRYLESFQEAEESVEAKVLSEKEVKSKKNSNEKLSKTNITKRGFSKSAEDILFYYDMTLSLPNSLIVSVVRKIARPCYIKQKYLIKSDSTLKTSLYEESRLFLPNGNVVVMMSDYTAQILKMDTSVIIADLYDIYQIAPSKPPPKKQREEVEEEEEQGEEGEEEEEEEEAEEEEQQQKRNLIRLESFEMLTPDGCLYIVDKRKKTQSKRLQIFKNNDYEFGTQYFRRSDGTNYMIQKDGSLCVQFKDGTKILSSFFTEEKISSKTKIYEGEEEEEREGGREEEEQDEEGDEEEGEEEEERGERDEEYIEGVEEDFMHDYVFVHYKVIVEHPDYVTVSFDSSTQNWEIILPYDSSVTVHSDGNYSVVMDKRTELTVDDKILKMTRYSGSREILCSAVANLHAFEKGSSEFYCQVKNKVGKTFVVEANANCYMLNDLFGESLSIIPKKSYQQETQSVFSTDLGEGKKLQQENKHFVVRRDISGMEVLHKEQVNKILTEKHKGQIVYTVDLPGTDNLRSFILVSPVTAKKKNLRKWAVASILPNPKYDPIKKKKEFSSTYGMPPTWMHPLPKRKGKFEMPEYLSCRVFTETIRTDLDPPVGEFSCSFCEYDGDVEQNHTIVQSGWHNIQNFLRKLGHDDQLMLKEMYALKAKEILTEKIKVKPEPSESLKHYLKMSKSSLEMAEYHKECIKNHNIPNFFKSPYGFIWLILNAHLNKLNLREKKYKRSVAEEAHTKTTSVSISSRTTSTAEELEYNLNVSYRQSFSDLSCKTNITSKSAHAALTLGGICRCKIRDPRVIISSPEIRTIPRKVQDESTYKFEKQPCVFTAEDFEELAKSKENKNKNEITVEDLMCLGLV